MARYPGWDNTPWSTGCGCGKIGYPPWSGTCGCGKGGDGGNGHVGAVEAEAAPGSNRVLIVMGALGLAMVGAVLLYAKYPELGRY